MHLPCGTPRWLRRLVPGGLLGRSLLILILPMVLVQVVTSVVFYDRHWGTVTRRMADGIAGDVAAVLELMHRFPYPESRAWVWDLAATHMDLAVSLHPGEVLPPEAVNNNAILFDATLERHLAEAVEARVRRPVAVSAAFLEPDLIVRVQLAEGVLEVIAPRKRLFSSTTYIFVLWMVGSALVLTAIATVVLSNQVRSIRRLAASVDGFGKGRDLPPIKPEGAREVRQAAHAFNVMRERIRRQVQQRTEMLAGVSHDLRTPLTRMKLQLALMPPSQETTDLSEDVVEMERMVEGYLAFVRGEGTEAVADTDLGALVETVAARFRREGRAVAVHGDLDGPVLPLRQGAVERALGNLLSNALRHAARVEVTLHPCAAPEADGGGRMVEIWVEDDGPGIPPDQQEAVFRPFVRGEPSRNAQTGGIGLGLTIARDVARVHGGDVLLTSSQRLGGLRAILRLPL